MRGVPRLFLDASLFIAAIGSPTGASALVLEMCRHGQAQAVSSRLVLLEAERNIRAKFGRDALLRFYREIANLNPELVAPPTPQEVAKMQQIIHPKDAHVLAAALKGGVEILLTLDRAHFLSPPVVEAGLPFRIMTPGDFLRSWVED